MSDSPLNHSSENTKPTFFNVMPEAISSGEALRKTPLARSPQVASETNSMEAVSSRLRIPTRRGSKTLLLVPVALIILALIAGAIWYFFIRQPGNSTSEVPVITAPEPTAVPDVTTPGDWLARYFKSDTCTEINICGDKADPDRDGLNNKEEFETGADPNNADSDSEGIADGDEKLVFSTDPLLGRTYREGNYNDADFIKGGYDIKTNAAYTPERLAEIKSNISQLGLHQPTISTLGDIAMTLYGFDSPEVNPNVDQSPEAKLDRDSQRRLTIKQVGGALLKFKDAKKSYPAVGDFAAMVDLIRSYNIVATNYTDPINVGKYVYGYEVGANNLDFTLTYFSETANQLIKYKAKDAQEDAAKEGTSTRDEQRRMDLERIKSALMVYSNSKLDPNGGPLYVFPAKTDYPNAIVPKYMTELPKDPLTKADYDYQVTQNLDSFTLKAVLENPAPNSSGYECSEVECRDIPNVAL